MLLCFLEKQESVVTSAPSPEAQAQFWECKRRDSYCAEDPLDTHRSAPSNTSLLIQSLETLNISNYKPDKPKHLVFSKGKSTDHPLGAHTSVRRPVQHKSTLSINKNNYFDDFMASSPLTFMAVSQPSLSIYQV